MKTGLCQFSGFKIYAGHGIRFIRSDNKTFTFVDNKSERYFLLRRNPRKVRWTQIYRRLHKKGTTEEVTRKRARKTQKLQRAIVGASLEVIRQKRNQKPEVRAASREAALREIKERKKQKKVEKTKTTKTTGTKTSAPTKSKQPKKAPAQKGGQKR